MIHKSVIKMGPKLTQSKIYDNFIDIEPINITYRNEIYKADNKIIKIFKGETRWKQEILALNNINYHDLEIPKITDSGKNNDIYWIEADIVPGTPIIDLTNIFESKELIKNMANHLGKLHRNNKITDLKLWSKLPNDAYNLNLNRLIILNEKRLLKLSQSKYFPKDLLTMIDMKLIKVNFKKWNKNLVLCHNDFSHRNLLAINENDKVYIKSLIDFELSFPAEGISDLSRFLLDILANSKYEIANDYISTYISLLNNNENLSDKIMFYLISLCVEIMTWSYDNAHDYYKTILSTLTKLLIQETLFKEIFEG